VSALVIGIGTRHRGDDAVGLEVVGRLEKHRLPSGTRIRLCRADPSELIDAWRGVGLCIVVDAMRSGRVPGTVHRFEGTDGELPLVAATSSHALGLAETVELARTLGALPGRLILIGVEVTRLDLGETLSDPVSRAVDRAVVTVVDALSDQISGGHAAV
jgi:hydrogenase maturation protease